MATIKSYDGRNLNDADVLAWLEASKRGGWTNDEAMDAVHRHYAVETVWLMPAHVTRLIKEKRQDGRRGEVVRELTAASEPEVVFDGSDWPVGDDPWGGKRNSLQLEQVHVEANVIECDYCKRPAGERCWNVKTGNATKIPHVFRLARMGRGAAEGVES
jgi:hypothetical protein